MKKITIYCNARVRQRLQRSLRLWIEIYQDPLEAVLLADRAWELLEAVKLGEAKLIYTNITKELGSYMWNFSNNNDIKLLGAAIALPWSRKCWSPSDKRFIKWARNCSVLAVRNFVQ